MKKHLSCGVLLATAHSISLSSSSLTLNAKDTRPIAKSPRAATQAILPTIQTIPIKAPHPFIRFIKKYKARFAALLGLIWLWLLARFHYIGEKRRQVSRWQFDNLALLKAIKDNVLRLWSNHRPDRKIIRLEDWRGKS